MLLMSSSTNPTYPPKHPNQTKGGVIYGMSSMELIGFSSGVPPNRYDDKPVVICSRPLEQSLEGGIGLACMKDGVTACYSTLTSELEAILTNSETIKVFHNSALSVSLLRKVGITVTNVNCLTLMAKVLGERYTDLNFLSFKYLGEMFQTDCGSLILDISLQEDALKRTYILYKMLLTEIVGRGLYEVYSRENKANAIIPRLNCDGVLFQFDAWDKSLDGERAEISELEASIKTMLNSPDIDLKAPAQVIEALHRADISIHSLSDESLSSSESLHPVIPLLLRYRKKSVKVRTFGASLKEHIGCDGRLRGSWNILGCRSGRMSCVSPPLQAMPGKSRSFFQPEKGNVFVIGDYSQIELRVLAEISGDETLGKQFLDGADLHSGTAALIYQKSIDQVTQEERQVGKSLNFGVVYGITEFGIRNSLLKNCVDITLDEAAHFKMLFLKAYPKVALLQNTLLRSTAVKTLGGRSWYCSKLTLNQRLNYPIQGTAAEGLKEALIILNPQLKRTWKLCAIVHDEVLLEVPNSEAEAAKTILQQSMVQGMKKFVKSIPVVVETTLNYNWNRKEG